MTDQTILFGKTLSLKALEAEVAAYEELLGPLKALGRTPDKSAGTYKIGPSPDQPVELIQKVGGMAVVPDGYVEVCEGEVWVTGQPQHVVAVRKTQG